VDVMAERLGLPFGSVEATQGDAGVVLKDGGAVIEQNTSKVGEVAAVQEVGAYRRPGCPGIGLS
jgi:hypothetical protein